nr:DNA-processing protein DprA [uncultured Azospirillum sp.]
MLIGQQSEAKRMVASGSQYEPPFQQHSMKLSSMMSFCGRKAPDETQMSFLAGGKAGLDSDGDIDIHWAGDLTLLKVPCVSIIGTRKVSREGAARARRLARELTQAGVVVVSGLAEGVDTEALQSAIDEGGRTVAVIGTPLDKAYPAQNKRLQERIWRDHLLVSQFSSGERVFKANFPRRNRLMATLSDASVVIEASDTSGTLHQAAECARLGRWLFIAKSVVDDPKLNWPKKFLSHPTCVVLSSTSDILEKLCI